MWQDNPPEYDDHRPAIASYYSTTVNEFVRGDDDDLYQRVNGGGWSNRSGCLRSGPGAAALNATKVNVFVRWCDDSLYQRRYTGSWSGWAPTHGYSCLRGSPAATSSPSDPNRVDVFYRGCSSDTLYHTYSTNSGISWSNAAAVPGVCTKSAPAAVSWGGERLDVVYVGCSSPQLWHNWRQQHNGSWYGEALGGCTMLAPGLATIGSGYLTAFARGCGAGGPSDEGFYFNSQYSGGPWSGWLNLGGCLSSGPGAGAWGYHALDALYRGCASPPNSLWNRYWHGYWGNELLGAWPP